MEEYTTFRFTRDTTEEEVDQYVQFLLEYNMKLLDTEKDQKLDIDMEKAAAIPLHRKVRYHIDLVRDYTSPPFQGHIDQMIEFYKRCFHEPNKWFWRYDNFLPRKFESKCDNPNWRCIMHQIVTVRPEFEVLEKNFIHPGFLAQAERCVQQLERCRDCYTSLYNTPQYLRIQYLRGNLTKDQWKSTIRREEMRRFCAMDMIDIINRWIFDCKNRIDQFNFTSVIGEEFLSILMDLGHALIQWSSVCQLYKDVWVDMPTPDIFKPSYHTRCFVHHPIAKPLEPLVRKFKRLALPPPQPIEHMHQLAAQLTDGVRSIIVQLRQ